MIACLTGYFFRVFQVNEGKRQASEEKFLLSGTTANFALAFARLKKREKK